MTISKHRAELLMTRKYSCAEIDQMRAAIENGFCRPADDAKAAIIIEERLRTYMANGTSPQELETAAEEFYKRFEALYLPKVER